MKDWAKSHQAQLEKQQAAGKNKNEQVRAALNTAMKGMKYQKELEEAKTDEEKQAIKEKMESEMASTLLQIMWTTTVVDITSTLWEVAQMIFFDQSVDKETRMKRADGLKNLGQIFMDCPPPPTVAGEEVKGAQKLYEEAAFAAMLETVQRNDQAAFDKEHMFNN